MSIRVHFQDVTPSDRIRRECESSVESLQREFPETSKFEFTLTHEGGTHEAHVHVTGKDLEIASIGQGETPGESLMEALEKTRRQLRKRHDKITLAKRREGNRRAP